MAVALTSPIAGVAANKEATLETVYPSVAMTGLGQFVAGLLGPAVKIPFAPARIVACLILGPIAILPALLAYVLLKVFGNCYEVTNRSVRQRKIVGGVRLKEVSLADVADVQIIVRSGYEFHRVGDVQLLNSQGNVLFTIPAIAYPQRLAHVIQEACEARSQADESLKQIQSRR